jgi:leukotriene-A4 hydrolase
MKVLKLSLLLVVSLLFVQCGGEEKEEEEEQKEETTSNQPVKTTTDKQYTITDHSYANASEVFAKHLHLGIAVDFDSKIISGTITYDIENKAGVDHMILDVYDLEVEKVLVDGEEAEFSVGAHHQLLGAPLDISIKNNSKKISVQYKTAPNALALQWLDPQQTAGKKHPYLFTQGQAILTRSWLPCQDLPGIRVTYSADVKVDPQLMAVMSASNPVAKNETGEYSFEMKQSIPVYLMALAVGDLEFAPIGDRTGVYTEPSMLDKSAYELADMEKMLIAAEGLYGDYKWDRYDVIVLPPSFPFGGMENPRLTFATPTILAGDRSLTSLIAHELAHSWSGNLVTNATWDDFWLNEGFTTYFENRIMEAIYGADYANMLSNLNRQGLVEEIKEMEKGGNEEDTHLKLHLHGRSPDDGMTTIAYDKGSFFLKTLEKTVGREKFDAFLMDYFTKHQFETMTTEKFVDYLQAELLNKNDIAFNVDEWIYGPGLPENCIVVESDKFTLVQAEVDRWLGDTPAKELKTEGWTTHEWLFFIRHLPGDQLTEERMKDLDGAFGFTNSGNSEILAAWFVTAINHDYHEVHTKLEEFLVNVGRRKFLTPLYGALVDAGEKELALDIYKKARPNYHSVSYNTIDEMLGWKG